MAEYHGSARLRAEFEKRLGRSVDDAAWQKLLATEYGDLDESEVLEADPHGVIEGMMEFLSTLATEVGKPAVLTPPASWTNFWRTRVLPTFRDDQLRCLGAFGLRNPIALEDVAGFLDGAAQTSWGQSDASSARRDDPGISLRVPAPDGDGLTCKTLWFDWELRSPLLFLKETASALVRQNPEVSEEDAVGYLMADVPFSPTWLKARCDLWGHVELSVGSLEVRPEEVAAAYASARRDYLRRVKEDPARFDEVWALMGARGWLTRDYRRSAESHADLIQFMNARMSDGGSRRDAAKAWKSEHPDDPRAVDSLTRTYLRYATKGAL